MRRYGRAWRWGLVAFYGASTVFFCWVVLLRLMAWPDVELVKVSVLALGTGILVWLTAMFVAHARRGGR